MEDNDRNYSGLSALFINCTLKKSPQKSHTELLINASRGIMEKQGLHTTLIRSVDHEIASGVYPDMKEHGWDKDSWPEIFKKVLAADILVLAGPIWLGDNSSEMKKVIERLYAHSGDTNERGQYIYYGKVGGCLITGNEDGVKHCAMNVLYSLQHLGYTIPPQADAGWVGEAGPGPSYGDRRNDGTVVGIGNSHTQRGITFMAWNLMHMARLLQISQGLPEHGNSLTAWEDGERFDYEDPEV